MATRSTKDLKRLLRVQQAIKARHQREHAEAEGRVAAAKRSVADISTMIEEDGPIVRLFPDLLSRHFQTKVEERDAATEDAARAGSAFLRELKRLEAMEERFSVLRAADERQEDEAAQSETLDQKIGRTLPASSKIGKLR